MSLYLVNLDLRVAKIIGKMKKFPKIPIRTKNIVANK